jgi:phosphate transport system protein
MDTFNQEKAAALACSRKTLNEEFDRAMASLKDHAKGDTENITQYINIMLALKSLGRIGDHARNLAEQAIFIVTGNDVRHQKEAYCPT